THGNAAGIGLADFATTRLVRAMNYQATVINCLTSGYPEGANLPVHLDSDRQVVDSALAILGTREPKHARIMHIRNTLTLDEVEAWERCVAELPRATRFEVMGAPKSLAFDTEGNLSPC